MTLAILALALSAGLNLAVGAPAHGLSVEQCGDIATLAKDIARLRDQGVSVKTAQGLIDETKESADTKAMGDMMVKSVYAAPGLSPDEVFGLTFAECREEGEK